MKYLIVEKITKRCSSLFRAARRQANHNPRKPPKTPPRAQLIACDGLPLFAFVALVGGGGGNQGNEEGLLLSWVMYPDSSRRPSERTSVRIAPSRSSRSRRVPKGPPSARSQKSAQFIVFAKGILNKTGAQIFSKFLRQTGVPEGPRKGPPPPGAKKVHNSSFLQKSFLTIFFTDFFSKF